MSSGTEHKGTDAPLGDSISPVLALELSTDDLAAVLPACPVCQRADALWVVGDVLFCAACGYSSQGGHGCT